MENPNIYAIFMTIVGRNGQSSTDQKPGCAACHQCTVRGICFPEAEPIQPYKEHTFVFYLERKPDS